MKKIYFALVFVGLLLTTQQASAAQIFGLEKTLSVTEKILSIDVNTSDSGIILEVYDSQNKRVAGPNTTLGAISPINARINVYDLARGAEYTLKGKDKDPKSTGDTFEITFTTVKTDTRSAGTGNFYYTTSNDILSYDTNRPVSFFQFKDLASCDKARLKTIDDFRKTQNTAWSTVSITPCFESKTLPTVAEFNTKMSLVSSVQGTTLYYFSYRSLDSGTFTASLGYDTLDICKGNEEIRKDVIVQHCAASTTPPTRPAGWVDGYQVVDPLQKNKYDDTYTLLAPLDNETQTIGKDKTIGDYLNLLLKIAIALCGALAVIMLVIYGVTYMGDESIFGKTEAKGHMLSAIGGLLIALGAYFLLNTINPDLVGGKVTVKGVNIVLEEDPMTANDPVPPNGTPAAKCPEGIITVSTSGGSFPTCTTISENLKTMVNLAWSQGMKISGYGFRTKASQIKLREKNCGGTSNVYNVNAKCNPDTAMPGTSMHESGLAFDLQCEGKVIRARDNKCFVWLKANAATYGLKNLASEPWHWSTTGH